jgi:hypothetical protein
MTSGPTVPLSTGNAASPPTPPMVTVFGVVLSLILSLLVVSRVQ